MLLFSASEHNIIISTDTTITRNNMMVDANISNYISYTNRNMESNNLYRTLLSRYNDPQFMINLFQKAIVQDFCDQLRSSDCSYQQTIIDVIQQLILSGDISELAILHDICKFTIDDQIVTIGVNSGNAEMLEFLISRAEDYTPSNQVITLADGNNELLKILT